MRPDPLTLRMPVALGAAALALAAPAAASAETTRYEAENYTATAKSRAVVKDKAASGGKVRWLYANGTIEIPVLTGVTSFTVRLKGTSCARPGGNGAGAAAYQLASYPGYFQQDPYIDPDPVVIGSPSVTSWAAPADWVDWTFRLPFAYQQPGPLTGGEPNRLQVRFVNDYRLKPGCDRNLAVDYVDVES